MPINSPDVFNVVGDAVITSGGGGGAVSDVTGTAPINVSPTTGNVIVSLNTTGVVSHDTQPTLNGNLNASGNNLTDSNNTDNGRIQWGTNDVTLVADTVGTIWQASTNSNTFSIFQPIRLGSATSISSTDKIKIKSANSTSAIKVDNASNTEVFNLEMDSGGLAELNMPTGKVAVENLTLGATGSTYRFPNAVGSTGEVLKLNGTNLEFGTASGGVSSVTGSAPISSSGGTTPDISHDVSGVSAGSYPQASITVNDTGHVTSAEAGKELLILKGESNSTGMSGRNTFFTSTDWKEGNFIDTGATTYTFSNNEDLIRYPIVNFQQRLEGTISFDGFIIFGNNVPAGRQAFVINVYEGTFANGATTPTFTRVGVSSNISVSVSSNQMQYFDRVDVSYSASALDYLLVGIGNPSTTQALSTSTVRVSMQGRFVLG